MTDNIKEEDRMPPIPIPQVNIKIETQPFHSNEIYNPMPVEVKIEPPEPCSEIKTEPFDEYPNNLIHCVQVKTEISDESFNTNFNINNDPLKIEPEIYKEPKSKKDFKCELCGKNFSRHEVLKRHIKIIHEGVKDFKCNQCNKAFGQQENLKRWHS